MNKNIFIKYFRINFATIGWIFLIISILTAGQTTTNYFSFFTIESNIMAILWFTVAIFVSDKNNYILKPETRGAIAVYLIVTMIVFFVLLGKQFSGVNFVNSYGLHFIIPVAYLLDWIMNKPKQKIRLNSILIWLFFPVLFCVYTLIRGKIIGWYPYFFLSPVEAGSYLTVSKYIFGLLVFFIFVNVIVFLLNNKLVKNN